MKDRKVQKMIRNNDLLPHPQLHLMRSGIWGNMVKIHVPFYIILAFTGRYWAFLASFDLMIMFAFLGYHFIWKKLVRKQIIPAHYRFQYDSLHQVVGMVVISGAILRTVLLAAYYIFCLAWVTGDATHERWDYYWREGFGNLGSGVGWGLGLLTSVFMLYYLFYRKPFISIVEFSSQTRNYIKQHKSHYEYAANYVLKSRQIQQVAKTHTNKPYDVDQLIADMFGDSAPASGSTPTQAPNKTPKSKPQTEHAPVRRKARETENTTFTQVRRRAREK